MGRIDSWRTYRGHRRKLRWTHWTFCGLWSRVSIPAILSTIQPWEFLYLETSADFIQWYRTHLAGCVAIGILPRRCCLHVCDIWNWYCLVGLERLVLQFIFMHLDRACRISPNSWDTYSHEVTPTQDVADDIFGQVANLGFPSIRCLVENYVTRLPFIAGSAGTAPLTLLFKREFFLPSHSLPLPCLRARLAIKLFNVPWKLMDFVSAVQETAQRARFYCHQDERHKRPGVAWFSICPQVFGGAA